MRSISCSNNDSFQVETSVESGETAKGVLSDGNVVILEKKKKRSWGKSSEAHDVTIQSWSTTLAAKQSDAVGQVPQQCSSRWRSCPQRTPGPPRPLVDEKKRKHAETLQDSDTGTRTRDAAALIELLKYKHPTQSESKSNLGRKRRELPGLLKSIANQNKTRKIQGALVIFLNSITIWAELLNENITYITYENMVLLLISGHFSLYSLAGLSQCCARSTARVPRTRPHVLACAREHVTAAGSDEDEDEVSPSSSTTLVSTQESVHMVTNSNQEENLEICGK